MGITFAIFIPWGTTPVERELFTMYVIGSIIFVIEPFSSLVFNPSKSRLVLVLIFLVAVIMSEGVTGSRYMLCGFLGLK